MWTYHTWHSLHWHRLARQSSATNTAPRCHVATPVLCCSSFSTHPPAAPFCDTAAAPAAEDVPASLPAFNGDEAAFLGEPFLADGLGLDFGDWKTSTLPKQRPDSRYSSQQLLTDHVFLSISPQVSTSYATLKKSSDCQLWLSALQFVHMPFDQ